MQDVKSFIDSLANESIKKSIYSTYVRYGVESFDVLSVRKVLEERYAYSIFNDEF